MCIPRMPFSADYTFHCGWEHFGNQSFFMLVWARTRADIVALKSETDRGKGSESNTQIGVDDGIEARSRTLSSKSFSERRTEFRVEAC